MAATSGGTFTAASSDVSNYKRVGGAGDQVARFFVTGNVASGSGGGSPVIEAALVDVDGGVTVVLGRFRATCTLTAKRVGSDGTSGDYVCDVTFDEGSTSKLDLLGGFRSSQTKQAEWYVGVTDLSDQTSVVVYWVVSDEV